MGSLNASRLKSDFGCQSSSVSESIHDPQETMQREPVPASNCMKSLIADLSRLHPCLHPATAGTGCSKPPRPRAQEEDGMENRGILKLLPQQVSLEGNGNVRNHPKTSSPWPPNHSHWLCSAQCKTSSCLFVSRANPILSVLRYRARQKMTMRRNYQSKHSVFAITRLLHTLVDLH